MKVNYIVIVHTDTVGLIERTVVTCYMVLCKVKLDFPVSSSLM